MFQFSRILTGFFLVWLGGVTLTWGETKQKIYEEQSGFVKYEISGGGPLAEDVNITITGEGKLRFREWGSVALVEEEIEERTHGVLKDIRKTSFCQKREDGQFIDVDFETQKILERPTPQGVEIEDITVGMTQSGTMDVAGYTCDLWTRDGEQKCLYKGIPFLIEKRILGMRYTKKAVDVTFDMNVSTENCTVPNFPVQKFGLFKVGKKTKGKELPKEFFKVLSSVLEEVTRYLYENNMTMEKVPEKQRQEWMETIGSNVFEKQKELLPELFEAMQKARVCLTKARTEKKANICLEEVVSLKHDMVNDANNTVDSWKEIDKKKLLSSFDENIALFEPKMACIRAAQNLNDLSACMK